jgi:hypothetical protein
LFPPSINPKHLNSKVIPKQPKLSALSPKFNSAAQDPKHDIFTRSFLATPNTLIKTPSSSSIKFGLQGRDGEEYHEGEYQHYEENGQEVTEQVIAGQWVEVQRFEIEPSSAIPTSDVIQDPEVNPDGSDVQWPRYVIAAGLPQQPDSSFLQNPDSFLCPPTSPISTLPPSSPPVPPSLLPSSPPENNPRNTHPRYSFRPLHPVDYRESSSSSIFGETEKNSVYFPSESNRSDNFSYSWPSFWCHSKVEGWKSYPRLKGVAGVLQIPTNDKLWRH